MAKRKRKDPLLEALQGGRSYTFTISDGGDLACNRGKLKHGQTITLTPVTDPRQVQVGDLALVKWRGGGSILHWVGESRGDRFLIVNSLGGVNGWVDGSDILARASEIVDPEPRPSVPEMLDQLDVAYRTICEQGRPAPDDARMLRSVADDMRWYAGHIVPGQWDVLPRLNRWSFAQHLWHLSKEAKTAVHSETPESIPHLIDHGKEHVGKVAEGSALLERGEPM
jgi:hypothetical protein